MRKFVALRREDKNIWERRVPLIPEHIKEIKEKYGIEFLVQPFERRAFPNSEFEKAGATISENLSDADFVFAVKEIPIELLEENKTYMFFSHTIKGQDYNMPLLQKIIDLKATLFDYETITDENGRRLVFFGRFAGLAGMIDALNAFGKRLLAKKIENPFVKVKPSYDYTDSQEAKEEISSLKEEFVKYVNESQVSPIIIGFSGYGNVSKGAQEIADFLPITEILPDEIQKIVDEKKKGIYKVVFKEENLVKPIDKAQEFELQDYYNNPEKYEPIFENYLKNLTIFVNAVYWSEAYPRLVSKKFLKENFDKMRLEVIQDISCDIDGGVEITNRVTEPDNPGYIYNPITESYTDGYEGEGVLNLAVDNLPTELPKNASISFSNSLKEFVPGIVNADYEKSFDKVDLPAPIKRATIVYKGELTPDYIYLKEFLSK